jgi:hypothetical protein
MRFMIKEKGGVNAAVSIGRGLRLPTAGARRTQGETAGDQVW